MLNYSKHYDSSPYDGITCIITICCLQCNFAFFKETMTFLDYTFCQALDSGKEVQAVFCNISKAFKRVWHSGLFVKLQAAGVSVQISYTPVRSGELYTSPKLLA